MEKVKKILLICILYWAIGTPLWGNNPDVASDRGFKITVKVEEKQYDSLSIQSFSYEKQYEPLMILPFSSEVVFKGKEYLDPGFYLLKGDQDALTFFMISDDKNQVFKIIIRGEEVVFEGNKENAANQEYIVKMGAIDRQSKQLEQESRKLMQRNDFTQTQKQAIVDSIVTQFELLNTQRSVIQQEVLHIHQGTLLASMVQASIEMKNPPRDYFSNPKMMESYYIEHFFEHFPWNDFRILKTPVAYNKLLHFANFLARMSPEMANEFVDKTLTEIQPYPDSYHFVFDFLEKMFGVQASNSFMEMLYINMLKNALHYPELEEARKLRYTVELKRLDKNHPGMNAPDFKILLSTGDTTSLYDIQSDYLLLILQNPDCPTCKELRKKLEEIEPLNQAIADQKIEILTLYFEQNETLWRNYPVNANPDWIHGWNYDLKIENDELYDTYIIPFMFLLDKDKKIIKKDIFWTEIENWLIEAGIE